MGNLKETGSLEDLSVNGSIIFRCILKKRVWEREREWNLLIWHRIGKSGGLLWTQLWTSVFYKIWGIFLASWKNSLLTSQDGLSAIELFVYMRFEVLSAVTINTIVLCNVTSCSIAEFRRCFGVTYYLHLQCLGITMKLEVLISHKPHYKLSHTKTSYFSQGNYSL